MLFDLRGRGRRRTVKVIYIGLALLMGGGLVLSGIGSDANGGLLDALVGSDNGGGSASADDRVKAAEKAVAARPRDPAAWGDLVRARFGRATDGDNYDQATGTYRSSGKARLREAADAWRRHVELARNPDPKVAAIAVRTFSNAGLNQPAEAAQAQEVITAAKPSAPAYTQLAVLAYQAGQTRKGDLAAGRAVDLAPADQRKQLKQQLDQLKASGGKLDAGQGQGQAAPAPAPAGG